MSAIDRGWWSGACVLLASPAFAVAAVAPVPAGVAEQRPTSPAAPSPAHQEDSVGRIPAFTDVSVEILSDLGSKISRTGETFPIRLAKPIVIDGVERVPAGAEGQGEIVWAKRSGGSGASGELVLAARWVVVDGRHLRLRSMHLSPVGQDKYKTVESINIASAAAAPVVSVIGYFITGKQAFVPRGTVAAARTAEEFKLGAPSDRQQVKAGDGTVPQPHQAEGMAK